MHKILLFKPISKRSALCRRYHKVALIVGFGSIQPAIPPIQSVCGMEIMMKNLKKGFAVCLLLVYVCVLSACGNGSEKDTDDMAGGSSQAPGTTTESTVGTGNTTPDTTPSAGNNNSVTEGNTGGNDSANDGLMDNTLGNDTDNVGSAVGDAVDDAGNAVGDVINDIGDGVKDVTDDVTGTNR